MKLGFLYAGQGSQKVGMGMDFYKSYPSYRKIIDSADKLNYCTDNETKTENEAEEDNTKLLSVKDISFTDIYGILNQTRYTQPCMVAFAVGVTTILRENGVFPAATLGLSLGEYSALHGADVLDGQTAISLVSFRGEVMEQAAHGIDSAMVAVLGLERQPLQQACEVASELGVVQIANYNCPGQLVIGGEAIAVRRAAELAKEAGARRCLPLNVSGPFHTSLLSAAGDRLAEKCKEITFATPKVPVLFNCLGGENSENIPIATLLERQVQSSVYLEDCIRAMDKLGVDAMVEIGPGHVLSGFVRKILPEMKVYPLEDVNDLKWLLETLEQEETHGTEG